MSASEAPIRTGKLAIISTTIAQMDDAVTATHEGGIES